MKTSILTKTLIASAIALTAIGTTGCSNSGKKADQQKGNPEQELLVMVSPSQVLSDMKKNPADASFDLALRAVDSVAQYDLGRTQQDDHDFAKEFCRIYLEQNASADFSNVLNLPELSPGATIEEAADAINKAAKAGIADRIIPVLEKRLTYAGATFLEIKPTAGNFPTLRILAGGLDGKNMESLISTKGNVDIRAGAQSEAQEAMEEIDRRSGYLLSAKSYSFSEIANPDNTTKEYAHKLDFKNALIGYFKQSDINMVDSILSQKEAIATLPSDVRLCWSYSPEIYGDGVYSLYVLKDRNSPDSNLGQYIDSAEVATDNILGAYISIKFNDKGAEIFERLTADNIGHELAITIDDKVMSAPRVCDRITGGYSLITGYYDEATLNRFAAILNGGAMPWDCKVIQCRPYTESKPENGE
ncbi:MAG: hypothetical protein K2G06_08830 [Muribaculaceae bacterium]|nr:hypothetical protein [Muribaculaceae bacterium]